MKEIVINGVTYLPASALAKEFRYTTDYIGQMCRTKKIDAQLVGRSWYVNPFSLKAHKQARYKKPSAVNKPAEKTSKTSFSRINVEAVMKRDLTKRVPTREGDFISVDEGKHVKYEADKSDLFPMISPRFDILPLPVDNKRNEEIVLQNKSKITNSSDSNINVKIVSLDKAENKPGKHVSSPSLATSSKGKPALHHSLPTLKAQHQLKSKKLAAFKAANTPAVAANITETVEVNNSALNIAIVLFTTIITLLVFYILSLLFTESVFEFVNGILSLEIHFSTSSFFELKDLILRRLLSTL